MEQEIVGLKEFCQNLSRYIAAIKSGGNFVIVKRSRPIFRVAPIDISNDGQWEEVIDFSKIRKGGVKIQDILARL